MSEEMKNYQQLVQSVAREIIAGSITHSEAVDAFKRKVATDITLRDSLSAVYLERNCNAEIYHQWTELKRESIDNYSLEVPASEIAGGDDSDQGNTTGMPAIPASNPPETKSEPVVEFGGGVNVNLSTKKQPRHHHQKQSNSARTSSW